jgi:hypothetical protein
MAKILSMGINRIAEQARKGELPVVKVVVGETSLDGYKSRGELRGWTEHMARKFLKPDRIRQYVLPSYLRAGRTGYEYEYSPEQVSAVEATEAWQKANVKANAKADKPFRPSPGGTHAFRRRGPGLGRGGRSPV